MFSCWTDLVVQLQTATTFAAFWSNAVYDLRNPLGSWQMLASIIFGLPCVAVAAILETIKSLGSSMYAFASWALHATNGPSLFWALGISGRDLLPLSRQRKWKNVEVQLSKIFCDLLRIEVAIDVEASRLPVSLSFEPLRLKEFLASSPEYFKVESGCLPQLVSCHTHVAIGCCSASCTSRTFRASLLTTQDKLTVAGVFRPGVVNRAGCITLRAPLPAAPSASGTGSAKTRSLRKFELQRGLRSTAFGANLTLTAVWAARSSTVH